MKPIHIAAGCLLAVFLAMPAGHAQAREFTGENPLDVETDLMKRVQEGLELIYQREYQEALHKFREVNELYPDSPVGHFGRSVVFQAMMLENFDYEYRDTYRVEADLAKAKVQRTLKTGHQKGWNTFLYAGIVGLDGLDSVREGDYLTAFNKGWEAIEAMKKAKRLSPEFADPDLGIGIYNYWRTAITDRVNYLPRFGDHRAEGLVQMENSRDNGLLVWAGASFALAYTYMEEREYDKAIAECLKLQADYPNSVINNMLLGRIYTKSKDYDAAIATYDKLLVSAPDNRRVHWHIGDCYYKSRRHNAEAKEAFNKYLEMNIPALYRCHSHFRLAGIAEREKDYAEAVSQYEKAVEADPSYTQAAKRLDKAREKLANPSTSSSSPRRKKKDP